MHPKFILVTKPEQPLKGLFVYGMVGQHKELVQPLGYAKVHGGGWYIKDDDAKTMTLYGSSGDYGEPKLAFLNQIPAELKGYRFLFSPGWNLPPNELALTDIEYV